MIYKILAWMIYLEILLNWGLCALKTINKVTPRRLNEALARRKGMITKGDIMQNSYPSNGNVLQDDGRDLQSDMSFSGVSLEEVNGLQNCPICQIYVPPRSHHCKVLL